MGTDLTVVSDFCSGLHDRIRPERHSLAQTGALGDNGGRMNHLLDYLNSVRGYNHGMGNSMPTLGARQSQAATGREEESRTPAKNSPDKSRD